MYKHVLKPLFFLLPPEKAHHLVVVLLRFVLNIPILSSLVRLFFKKEDKRLEREVLGLHFKNPIGLAAGFDKEGTYFKWMSALGFGHIEVGTVTPKPQDGNPKPRLFRLKTDNALINRMGFNNEGVDSLIKNLKRGKPENLIIGGNIGKNKITPNAEANEDYKYCFDALFPYVDYFVVNVSSPNTPGLRELQEKGPLTALLLELQQLNRQKETPKPILVKIAPDLTDDQLDDILDIVKKSEIAGVIATNTTISREGLQENGEIIEQLGAGGLSGKPLTDRSTEVIRYLSKKSGGTLTIIGVGGISSAEDAIIKLEAGASLVQIYTGLIYEGPRLIKKINKGLIEYYS